jgi:hypothetical protein
MNLQSSPDNMGRFLIIAGVVLVLVGLLMTFARALRFGSLPGDIHLSGRGWQIWLPLGTSIVLSLLLTLVLNLLFRRR